MKPYYQDDAVTLYHADCRDVLSVVGEETKIPATDSCMGHSFVRMPQIDLLLTDPPYGIGDRMQGGTWGSAKKYSDFRDWDKAPEQTLLDTMIHLSDKSIIWGGATLYVCSF